MLFAFIFTLVKSNASPLETVVYTHRFAYHVLTSMCMQIFVLLFVHVCACACVHVFMCVCVHTFLYACMHMQEYVWVCIDRCISLDILCHM